MIMKSTANLDICDDNRDSGVPYSRKNAFIKLGAVGSLMWSTVVSPDTTIHEVEAKASTGCRYWHITRGVPDEILRE